MNVLFYIVMNVVLPFSDGLTGWAWVGLSNSTIVQVELEKCFCQQFSKLLSFAFH